MDLKLFATVFAAASAALVFAAGIGVLAGSALSRWLDPRWLQVAAGLGFVAIGAWTLAQAWTGAD